MPYKNIEDRIKRSKQYHIENSEKIRSRVKRWRKENPEKCREYARKKNKKRTLNGTNKRKYIERREIIVDNRKKYELFAKDKIKNRNLKREHGITLDFFNDQLSLQNNSCKICLRKFEGKVHPQVDHCHSTGKFRSLLCRRCNMLEGFLLNHKELIEKIHEYQIKYSFIDPPQS